MGMGRILQRCHHNILYPTCCFYNVILTIFPLRGKCYVPSPQTWVDTCNFFNWESTMKVKPCDFWGCIRKKSHALSPYSVVMLAVESQLQCYKQPQRKALCSGSGWPTEVMAKSQYQLVSQVSEPLWKWILQIQLTAKIHHLAWMQIHELDQWLLF